MNRTDLQCPDTAEATSSEQGEIELDGDWLIIDLRLEELGPGHDFSRHCPQTIAGRREASVLLERVAGETSR